MASKAKINKANKANELKAEVEKRCELQPKYKKKGIEARIGTRNESRCKICGRPRAVYRKFGICRICFRKLADQGLIPGVKKSSW